MICIHRRNPISMKRQQGVVIVMALFIVALVAAMAYTMMSRLERDTRRTTLLVRDIEANQYAQGSIAWALDVLRANVEQKKPNQLIDQIPIKSEINDANGYTITSIIYDMQGRYNLNNLTKVEAQPDFKRLILAVDPKLSDQEVQQIVLAITDWVTPATQQTDFDKYYFELPTPYRSAHRAMQSISELRLVKGVTPALYNALEPYITALPNTAATLINVTTASAPVLLTLSPALTIDNLKALEKKRREAPITSTEMFINLDAVKDAHISSEKITTTSDYFLLETNVSIEKQRLVFYTLLERTSSENKPTVSILWQSKGIW